MIVGLDRISKNMTTWETTEKKAIARGMNDAMGDAQTNMYNGAPWNDITGRARKGLKGTTETGTGNVKGYMTTEMPYGVFLELCNNTKYQIIVPVWKTTRDNLLKKYMVRAWV